MKYRVEHITEYHYGSLASHSNNMLHLKPRDTPHQQLISHQLSIGPDPVNLRHWVDYFGNPTASFGIETPHELLKVSSESVVNVQASQAPMTELSSSLEEARTSFHEDRTKGGLDVYQYLFDSPFIPCADLYADYARDCFENGNTLLAGAMNLMTRIYEEFDYDPKATDLMTPVDEVLERKAGVCQDFAHLMLSCLRSIGVASRYVSGYLLTVAPPGQVKLVGADASHAWVSVACPRLGWIDLDPTNNCVPDNRHITVAWGRDYGDVSPVRGVVMGSGEQAMKVSVDVSPV